MLEKIRSFGPARIGLKLIITIVAAEALIMLAMSLFHAQTWLSPSLIILVNTIALGIAVFLVSYYWVVKPMKLLEASWDKESKELILRQQLLSDSIINNIPSGIAFLDNNFILRKCNSAYEDLIRRYTPYTPEQALGMSYFDYVPGSRHQVEEWFKMVRDSGQPFIRYGFELRIKGDDEEEIKTYWDTSIAPVPGSAGNTEGILILTQDVTLRRKAEEQILQAKLNWEDTFNTITDMITIHDKDFNIIRANKAAMAILDLPFLNVTKAKCYEYYHGTDGPSEGCPSCECLKTGFPVTFELFEPHLNKFIEIRAIPRFDSNDKLIGLIHVVRDITEHKKAVEVLKASHEYAKNVIESSLDIIISVDNDRKIIEFNKAAQETFGYSSEEVLGKHVDFLYADPEDGLTVHKTTIEHGRCVQEILNRRKNDEVFPSSLSASVLLDAQGKVVGVMGVSRDITERKIAEEALRESEKRYKRLVGSITDYIYTVKVENGQPVETVHGPGCIAVTGYTSEEYQADPSLWYRMIYHEDREAVIEQSKKVSQGDASPIEHRIIHKSGHICWVKNTPVPHYDEHYRLIAYDGLISDITELKKIEEQLMHAQKMEAIGQLAAGVAHDFNNILTAIVGYGNILKIKLKDNDHLQTYADQILASSERAANLTQSLLAFGRKQVITLRPVNLNELVMRVEKLLSRLINENIELNDATTTATLVAMADSGQIEQVLINLCTNARDAMPDGGILTIKTELIELDSEYIQAHGYGKPGPYAIISVSDTGEGMTEEIKRKIFEPFFTTKEIGKGTGLGLAIVYGIIKQHNGYINVYSEPDKGTTFKIYLPVIKAEVEEEKPSEHIKPIGGTETILFAEDDVDVREMTKAVLEEFGYTVIEAVDGEDAMNKFIANKDKIQFCLLDIGMPKKNGKEVYDQIKKIKPDINVLFTSGYTLDFIHKLEILDKGLNFIAKPVSPTGILKKVREILDK